MFIKVSKDYEYANQVILSHLDKIYVNNCSFNLTCIKSRKIDEEKVYKWGSLGFNFELINHDMQYRSIGSYNSVLLTKSDFIEWITSIQEAVNNPDCYQENLIVKRRIKDSELFVKFAISQKMNNNAVMIGIYNSKSGYIYTGFGSLLFNQYMMQLGRLAVDILNYEMNFEQSILLYQNNQLLNYQIQQNNQLIYTLSNLNNNHITPVDDFNLVVEDNKETTKDENVDFIADTQNLTELENNENKEIVENNEKILEENQEEFLENIDKNLEETELETVFPQRLEELENPPIEENKELETNILKFVKRTGTDITLFSDIFEIFQNKKCSFEKCYNIFYKKILDSDKDFSYPYCSENDSKSIFYLSYLQYMRFFKLALQNESLDQIDIFHLKYDLQGELSFDQISDIYDLVSIYLFLLSVHKKLKTRSVKPLENKQMFCEFFRLIFEPLYLSYLTTIDDLAKTYEQTIINHYTALYNANFFKSFNTLLTEYQLKPVSIKDIKYHILELKDIISENKKSLKSIHEDFVLNHIVKLSYKNVFNKEHIYEICSIESVLGNTKISKESLQKIVETKKISNKNVIKFLKKIYIEKKKQNPNDTKQLARINALDKALDKALDANAKLLKNQKTSLYRFVNKVVKNGAVYKNKLLDYIDNLQFADFEFKDIEFVSLHKLPEVVLIALYNWKSVEEKPDLKSYSKFIKIIENSIDTKQDIISRYIAEKDNKTENKNSDDDTDWSSVI